MCSYCGCGKSQNHPDQPAVQANKPTANRRPAEKTRASRKAAVR